MTRTTSTVPDVTPLLPDERPPTDPPNYYDRREMSSGGIATKFETCKSTSLKDPRILDAQADAYCTCSTDGLRRNFRATGDLSKSGLSWEQIQRCSAFSNSAYTRVLTGSSATSPDAVPFPKDTPNVISIWNACVRAGSGAEAVPFCDCYVDAQLNGKGPIALPSDEQRCEVVARYWATTSLNLTARQFDALKVAN
jgi:hypothetical protein